MLFGVSKQFTDKFSTTNIMEKICPVPFMKWAIQLTLGRKEGPEIEACFDDKAKERVLYNPCKQRTCLKQRISNSLSDDRGFPFDIPCSLFQNFGHALKSATNFDKKILVIL